MAEDGSPFLRFLSEMHGHLDEVRDADKALKISLRLAREAFGADEACFARIPPGKRRAEPFLALPPGSLWRQQLLSDYLAGRRPRLTPDLLLATLERRGRRWGALALRMRRTGFDAEAVRDVARVGQAISRLVQRIDRMRIAEVRARIDRKMMEQLRPKDLFYQILHGLRTLTHYDHSAAILTHDQAAGALEVVAEQIAWRKGKSRRIGTRAVLAPDVRGLMEAGGVFGFDLERGRWREWQGREAGGLARVIDYNRKADGEEDERRESSILCASMLTREGVLGIVKVAACHAGTLGAFEAELLQRFLPQAAVAISNLNRTASLETGLLEAEKRQVLAGLARGVSHDVNNAFGSVLPLVQQMIVDANAGRIERDVLVKDLEQIEESLQVCRRIFGGMLSFAKGAAQSVGEGEVTRAIESALTVLEERLRRHAVRVQRDLPAKLPHVSGSQADLEQLFLNLATNALDAMPSGGGLWVEARAADGQLDVVLRDDGCGIPAENLGRVKEPFFTTKPSGNGLGLSICRAIVWKMGGRMSIESQEGEGTCVRLFLPLTGEPRPAGGGPERSPDAKRRERDA